MLCRFWLWGKSLKGRICLSRHPGLLPSASARIGQQANLRRPRNVKRAQGKAFFPRVGRIHHSAVENATRQWPKSRDERDTVAINRDGPSLGWLGNATWGNIKGLKGMAGEFNGIASFMRTPGTQVSEFQEADALFLDYLKENPKPSGPKYARRSRRCSRVPPMSAKCRLLQVSRVHHVGGVLLSRQFAARIIAFLTTATISRLTYWVVLFAYYNPWKTFSPPKLRVNCRLNEEPLKSPIRDLSFEARCRFAIQIYMFLINLGVEVSLVRSNGRPRIYTWKNGTQRL